MVKIYYTINDRQFDRQALSFHLGALPLNVRQKALRFRKWQDMQAAILGKLLLKKGLQDYGFMPELESIQYTDFDRPYLQGTLDFNISHSGLFVVCAFADIGRIGVDIEACQPFAITDFEHFFEPG